MIRITALSVALIAGLASAASATPVNVSWDGDTSGSATNGGPFELVLSDPDSGDTFSNFIAWCFELTEFINLGPRLYEVVDDPSTISGPPISSTQADNLAKLFDYYYTLTPNSSVNTQMQSAIWTEVYGDSFTGGTSIGGNQSGVSDAEYQAGLDFRDFALDNFSGERIKLTFLIADGQQVGDRTMGVNQDFVGASIVPLPAGLWLMIGGLGAFAAVRRWQKQTA